jgi:capsular polysaccharide transport system permease protein
MQKRSPWQVTLHVWHALFMREAMARMTGDRLGWVWIFIEPIAHIVIFVGIRQLMGRVRHISGAEFMPWFIVGMVSYLLFSTVMNRSMNAITSNRALFAYRQVHPVDTVLVRAALEGTLKVLILTLLIAGALVFDINLIPANAIYAAAIWISIWGFGLGAALVLSVMVTAVQESGKFVSMITMPLYFLSGVLFPIQFLPREIQQFLLYNPIFHAVELMRSAFFPHYQLIQGISLQYLLSWTVALLLLGLMLQLRFKARLMAQ